MAVEIKDVPKWIVFDGISHAASGADDFLVYTACNHGMTGELVDQPGRRICRACRERLKVATLKGGE